MILDEFLCRKAEELYGWSLSFEGELKVIKEGVITREIWMPLQEEPKALFVRSDYLWQDEEIPKSYGFLDLSQRAQVYQEAAKVYPITYQKGAFHPELLNAVIFHLKQLPEGVRPMVQLPASLREKVHPRHFSFLEMNIRHHQPNESGGRRCERRCRHPYHRAENYKLLQMFDLDDRDICTLL